VAILPVGALGAVSLTRGVDIAGGRLISAVLYGVEPSDPRAMLLAAATLLIIAAFAAVVPAWRAARVDPTVALRAE
jgi:putative ABC transport system permease protein